MVEKQVQLKEDGRYIIFYTFPEKKKDEDVIPCPNCAGTPSSDNG